MIECSTYINLNDICPDPHTCCLCCDKQRECPPGNKCPEYDSVEFACDCESAVKVKGEGK